MGKWLIPCLNKVLVEMIVPPSKTSAGILPLRKTSKLLKTGKVVAVGPGRCDRDGNLIPVAVKVGDTVILPEYGITAINIHDRKCYRFYWDDDILGTLHDCD